VARPDFARAGRRASLALVVTSTLLCPALPAYAQLDQELRSPTELKNLSLDELFNVEVTLVSKRPQKLSETASAIQVITADDIRRSGAMSMADALRLAANVEVQQINAYAWVVSTRGFDALFANKLLVMIDGRTIYTPLDAGVFWDAQNIPLEDIDRIEVVSGPGGALWGANAVNGVINIVTRNAQATQGVSLSGTGGSFLQNAGLVRYGGKLGASTFYRVYAQRSEWAGTLTPNGDHGTNDWHATRGGFRVDATPSAANTIMVQGDDYGADEFNTPSDNSSLDGQHLLGHWTHAFAPTSAIDVQLYADRTWRRDLPSTIWDQLVTYDADVQHRFRFRTRHDVLWGGGYRLMLDEAQTSVWYVGFVPARKTLKLFSSFVQDEVTIVPDRLRVTVGTKIEQQTYSHLDAQPSLRFAWTPTTRQTVWAAISRAVRSPSRIDIDYHIPKTPPYAIAGGPGFHSEHLVAYEFGYRAEPARRVTLGVATFYNHYDDIYSVELANPPAPLPYTIQNGVAGQSWGVELSGAVQPAAWWRLRGGYTFFQKDLWSRPGHNVMNTVLANLGNDPRNQAMLQSKFDVGAHGRFDVVAHYVDQLPNPRVPNYISFDARVAAEFPHWQLAVIGQNLGDHAHAEFYAAQRVPRSISGKVSLDW